MGTESAFPLLKQALWDRPDCVGKLLGPGLGLRGCRGPLFAGPGLPQCSVHGFPVLGAPPLLRPVLLSPLRGVVAAVPPHAGEAVLSCVAALAFPPLPRPWLGQKLGCLGGKGGVPHLGLADAAGA